MINQLTQICYSTCMQLCENLNDIQKTLQTLFRNLEAFLRQYFKHESLKSWIKLSPKDHNFLEHWFEKSESDSELIGDQIAINKIITNTDRCQDQFCLRLNSNPCKRCMYLLQCLAYLEQICQKSAYLEKSQFSVIFSLTQESILKMCITSIFLIGVYPCLTKKIGIPIDRKINDTNYVLKNAGCISQASPSEKERQLQHIMGKFFKFLYNQNFRGFILNHHLGNLLTALLQLAYNNSLQSATSMNIKNLQNSETKLHIMQILNFVINKASKPVLVKELLLILGPLNTSVTQNNQKIMYSTPPVIKNFCVKSLNYIITQPCGLFAVMHELISQEIESPLCKNEELVVKIILAHPLLKKSPCKFYTILGLQLLEFFDDDKSFIIKQYRTVAGNILWNLCNIKPLYCKMYILQNIISAIKDLKTQDLSLQFKTLFLIFENIFDIEILVQQLSSILPMLIYCFSFLCKSVSCDKQIVTQLLVKFFEHLDEKECLVAAWNTLCPNSDSDICKVHLYLDTEAKLCFNIQENIQNCCFMNIDFMASAVIYLLNIMKITFRINFLHYLFKQLIDSLIKESNKEYVLDIIQHRNYLLLLKIFEEIGNHEEVLDLLILEPCKTFNFIKDIFEFCFEKSENISCKSLIRQLLLLSLNLALCIISLQSDLSSKMLIVPLQKIIDAKFDKDIMEIALNLQLFLTGKNSSVHINSVKEHRICSVYDQAFMDASSPDVAIQGHGILSLTRLLLKQDPITMHHKNKLFSLFQEKLQHGDSYVYLMSVNGLVALSDSYCEQVLKILTQQYIDAEQHIDLRLKVGEALVRICRLLDEMSFKYKTLLLNAFLFGCRDSDELFRTSSVVCLGEACRALGFNIISCLQEILLCICSLAKTDNSVNVRRAAMRAVVLLLEGTQCNLVELLGNQISVLYKNLKHIYYLDTDEIVKLNAQLALEEFNSIIDELLKSSNNFIQKIKTQRLSELSKIIDVPRKTKGKHNANSMSNKKPYNGKEKNKRSNEKKENALKLHVEKVVLNTAKDKKCDISLFNMLLSSLSTLDLKNYIILKSLEKKENFDIGVDTIDSLQLELESFLSFVVQRQQALNYKIRLLNDSDDAIEEKPSNLLHLHLHPKRSRLLEEKSLKKVKDTIKHQDNYTLSPVRNSKIKFSQSASGDLAIFPSPSQATHSSPVTLITKNDNPEKFWKFVETYNNKITKNDLQFLESLIKAHEDDSDYFKISSLGMHYTQKWIEDENQRKDKFKNLSNAVGNNKNYFDEDISPYGPLTQRLMSCLLEKENCEKDIADNHHLDFDNCNQLILKDLDIGNAIHIEQNLINELQEHGILDVENNFEDDEILQELQRCQKELKVVSSHNLEYEKKIYQLGIRQLTKQELMEKLKQSDQEIIDIHKKFSLSRQKRKSPLKKEKEYAWKILKDREFLINQLDSLFKGITS